MEDLSDLLSSPGGIGILSGLAGYAANAKRGTPINNIGAGAMSGLLGYQNAQTRQSGLLGAESTRQFQKAQIAHLDAQNQRILAEQEADKRMQQIGQNVTGAMRGGVDQVVGARFNPNALGNVSFNMESPQAQADYINTAQRLLQRKQAGETLSADQEDYLAAVSKAIEPVTQRTNPNAEAIALDAASQLMPMRPDIAKGYIELSKTLQGRELKPGSFYQNPISGAREYIGDPTKGVDFKNGSIIPMAGYEKLIGMNAALEGAKARASAEASGFNPVSRAEAIYNTGIDPLSYVGQGPNKPEALPPKIRNNAYSAGAESIAGKQGEILDASRAAAAGASERLISVNSIRDAIEGNKAFAGPFASQRLSMAQLASVLNVAGDTAQEKVVNTRAMINGLANMALDAASKLKGQGQVSDAERRLLEKASSGEISDMTLPEIKQVLDVTERQARRLHDNHAQLLKSAKGQGIDTWAFEAPGLPERALSLPDKPTASNLTRGAIYKTPKGNLRWNGLQFEDTK